MYKNFNLTESEKEEILKKHKSHGYGKPLNEQYEDEGVDADEPDMESDEVEDEDDMDGQTPSALKIDNVVHADTHFFTLFVTSNDSDSEAWVKVAINNRGNVERISIVNNEAGFDKNEIITLVKQKMNEGIFKKFPVIISWDMESGECSIDY